MRLMRRRFLRPISATVAQKATGTPFHNARKQRTAVLSDPLR